jgi:hypothetical protein
MALCHCAALCKCFLHLAAAQQRPDLHARRCCWLPCVSWHSCTCSTCSAHRLAESPILIVSVLHRGHLVAQLLALLVLGLLELLQPGELAGDCVVLLNGLLVHRPPGVHLLLRQSELLIDDIQLSFEVRLGGLECGDFIPRALHLHAESPIRWRQSRCLTTYASKATTRAPLDTLPQTSPLLDAPS